MTKKFLQVIKSPFFWCTLADLSILIVFYFLNEPIELIVAAMSGISYFILLAFNDKKGSTPLGVISIVLFGVIAYNTKTPMYETFILSIFFYLPILIIDIINNCKENKITSKKLTYFQRNKLLYLSILVILYSQFIFEIKNYTFMFSIMCSILTIVPLVAMILCVKNYYEQWYLWIFINIIFIITWILTYNYHDLGDIALLILWIFFLINSIFGLINWKKIYNNNRSRKYDE